MELVIDANIIMSALITPGTRTCDILFSNDFMFYAPEFLLEQFLEHRQEIFSKSSLSEEDFNLFLLLISSRIKFISFSEFERFISKAKELCPDPDDMEYFALALKLRCGIWSNDKKLKEQDKVKVYSTKDLIKIIFEIQTLPIHQGLKEYSHIDCMDDNRSIFCGE